MKTATLTFLRRLLAMALGALGLGAFAALPASAQQIPAPDLFDGQVACSMNVPTPPMYAAGTGGDAMDMTFAAALARKVMSGMAITVDAMGVPTDGTTSDAHLAGILYVVDPNNNNCGAGAWTQAEIDAGDAPTGTTAGDPKMPVAGDIAMDVGMGYTDTLTAFMAANTADQAVKDAEAALKALTDALTPGTADTPAITTARETLATAITVRNKANTDLAAVGAGPINMAGIAEWRAKGALEMAISGWNVAVGMAATAQNDLNPTAYVNKYVDINSAQLLALVDSEDNVNLANLRNYANAEGNNAASLSTTNGDVTGGNADSEDNAVSAFDAAGNLLIPKSANDDGDFVVDRTLATTDFQTVNTRLTGVNNVIKALEQLSAENKNPLMTPVITEALRRAKLEQTHTQMQFNTMIADNTDLRTDAELTAQYNDTDNSGTIEVDERTPGNEVDNPTRTALYSMKTRYDAWQAANTARDNAGVTLTTALTTREMATTAVRTAFTSPQSFYQQLVDRRSYKKNQADAEVKRLAGLTGDDAPTTAMTEAAEKAATDAQKALIAAQEVQASFQGLLADDSPVKELVEETLKPDDGADDDGGVLVNTIDNAFDAAEEAKTAADNAKATADTASDAVAGLTAMDDPMTEDVDETGAVTKNANDIAAINTSLEGLTGEGGQVGKNMSDIESLDSRVAANEEEIGMDEDGMSRIDHNEARSMANAKEIGMDEDGMSRIDHNEQRSMDNATAIGKNADNIETNAGNILANTMEIGMDEDGMSRIDHNEARSMANATAIGVNAGNITTNAESIVTNAGNIMANADNIAANETAIGTNAADIMTNAGNIAMNNTYIMENRTMIGANTTAIGANTAAIAAANSRIDANAMAVRELREDMSGGIAAAMALAGMPEIGDRGVSVGAGSYDGESAVAVGVHFSGENSRFKAAITSGGGETGVSVGAGWSF